MQDRLPEELKKWCYYDISKFSYQLKENAPEEIKKKFQIYQDKDLSRFNVENEWNKYNK